jgi:GT2 family glycosyltransferase
MEDLACEVFVVDNASDDGSVAMVHDRFPLVRLIANAENLGFARASNQAIRRSESHYVLLLNSDTLVLPGAMQALVRHMETHMRVGAVGARLLNSDGSLQPSCAPMPTPSLELWRLAFLDRIWRLATYPMHRWDTAQAHPVDAIKGACLLLRRQALDYVGLLDEGFFMYTEEVDLCFRLRKAGWELAWVPQAAVVHYAAQSTRQAAQRMHIELHRSKVRFYRKWGGQRRARFFKGVLWLAYAPRLALASLGGPFSDSLRERARIYRSVLAELKDM